MSTTGTVFMASKGRRIRFVQRHQGVSSDFWYLDAESGREFDVRELPMTYLGDDRAAVMGGDRQAHQRVIQRALASDYSFDRRQ